MIKINENNYQDVLFVHIPKTAGTSISLELNRKGLNKWVRNFYMGHDTFQVLSNNNIIKDDIFKFSVVRNPYARTYSYYRHFLKIHKFVQSDKSFIDFISLIESNIKPPKTPLISIDQTSYLINIDNEISLDKVYKFEELSSLEDDLSITLPHVNTGRYSKDEYMMVYQNEYTIHRVKELFRRDFEMLGYSKDFEKSIV
jgi:hypothetical protein